MFPTKSMFIGSHFWVAPIGAAFTSPAAGVIAQEGVWPDADEPLWDSWYLGIVGSSEVDPKYGPSEQILRPSPGTAQATKVLIPYAIPEVSITLLQNNRLVPQLALNTQQLWGTERTQFNPNGGGGPGLECILKAQKYDHENVRILNWMSWAFIQLKGTWKQDVKAMTKPEFMATLLYSSNNTGDDDQA
jgi:hypothetical protein